MHFVVERLKHHGEHDCGKDCVQKRLRYKVGKIDAEGGERE
jgi:hypothetical protein